MRGFCIGQRSYTEYGASEFDREASYNEEAAANWGLLRHGGGGPLPLSQDHRVGCLSEEIGSVPTTYRRS